jgi:hypothetical protein
MASEGVRHCTRISSGWSAAVAVCLIVGFLGLYHLNGDFLPGHDATPNIRLALNVLEGHGLSFTPAQAPSMYQWVASRAGKSHVVPIDSWDQAINGRSVESGSRFTREADRPRTWGAAYRQGWVRLKGPEYYLVPSVDPPHRGYVNQYGPGAGLTALPFFASCSLFVSDLAGNKAMVWYIGKFVAAFCVAVSVAAVFGALLPLVGRRHALAIAVAYGVGTCAWSVSSQTLWQSGPNVMYLALAACCLVRVERSDWWAIGCGIATACGVLCRPTSAVVAIVLAAYFIALAIGRWSRRSSIVLNMFRNEKGDGANLPERPGGCFARISSVPFFVARFRQHDTSEHVVVKAARPLFFYILAGLPFAVALGYYNWYYLGSPFTFGQTVAGARIAEMKLGNPDPWQGSFWEGFYGLLVSPSRGMLVYSPVLIFGFWGLVECWRRRQFRALRPLGVAAALILLMQAKWFDWHGGWSFGYRLMVDTTPLLAVCAGAVAVQVSRQRVLKAVFAATLVWSVGVQVIGAYAYHVTGWNCREAQLVVLPDNAGSAVFLDPERAELYAAEHGGRRQSVRLDVDRKPFRGRLWSLRDSQLVYYAMHFRQSRQEKKRLIGSWLGPV